MKRQAYTKSNTKHFPPKLKLLKQLQEKRKELIQIKKSWMVENELCQKWTELVQSLCPTEDMKEQETLSIVPQCCQEWISSETRDYSKEWHSILRSDKD